ISEVHAQPAIALDRSGLKEELGPENVLMTLDDALDLARRYLDVRTPTPLPFPKVQPPAS
ncbi:MAG: hypothetical protein ACREOG_19900, partial [Gemmatimonadaceae bacterium]